MYIRSASSPSTVLWAFHTIQPSCWTWNDKSPLSCWVIGIYVTRSHSCHAVLSTADLVFAAVHCQLEITAHTAKHWYYEFRMMSRWAGIVLQFFSVMLSVRTVKHFCHLFLHILVVCASASRRASSHFTPSVAIVVHEVTSSWSQVHLENSH